MGDLTQNFSVSEFSCRCGCGFDEIDFHLVSLLEKARQLFGPIGINSGCRCKTHNNSIRASPTSSHIKGLAADIACTNMQDRYRLMQILIAVGLKRIGVNRAFLHVDVDNKKPHGIFVY